MDLGGPSVPTGPGTAVRNRRIWKSIGKAGSFLFTWCSKLDFRMTAGKVVMRSRRPRLRIREMSFDRLHEHEFVQMFILSRLAGLLHQHANECRRQTEIVLAPNRPSLLRTFSMKMPPMLTAPAGYSHKP